MTFSEHKLNPPIKCWQCGKLLEYGWQIMPLDCSKNYECYKCLAKIELKEQVQDMKTHDLKIVSKHFQAIKDGKLTFLITENKDFKVGDRVNLAEWDEKLRQLDLRSLLLQITYVSTYRQSENGVVFSFEVIGEHSIGYLFKQG